MASVETIPASGDISPRLQKLLREVSYELSPIEQRHAVSSIKTNFRGKFEDQGEQDLYSCLQLFVKQGLVSEDNLTLLEGFLCPKASKKESLQEKIQQFKENRRQEVSSGKGESGLTGRERDLEKVMAMLTTGSSRVVNLRGISGVCKTTLAKEIFSKWPWRKFKADLKEITEMEDVHFRVLSALAPDQTIISFKASPVVQLMQQLRQAEQHSDILLLLDNVDKFAGGDDEVSASLNANFLEFLQELLGPKNYAGKSKLKLLLTSRSSLRHARLANVDNYEVMALEDASSCFLLQNQRIVGVREGQIEKTQQIYQGNSFIIKGMTAILRQQMADDTRILETIEQPLAAEPQESGIPPAKESGERDVFNSEKEGIDKEQESCLRKLFFFLPSKQLKDSAISMSLFCRSFSVEAAAEVLEVDSSEAVIQLEGLRNSEVLTLDTDVKELTYDIHPLVRTFLRSIGSNQMMFVKVYEKAKTRFCKYFMSKMVHISGLLDKDYMNAFDNFDLDKPNFELALDISFKLDHLLIPKEHRESVMIFYLFEAMLDEKASKNIFNCWAEKVKEDGKEGSLLRAELKCHETLMVLKLEGWQRALTVARRAKELLSKVQKEIKSKESFRLTKSSYLFSRGEVYYRAGNMAKSLRILHKALKIMENILHSHTSTSRCLNAIGNCYNKLEEHDEAMKYYMRAYDIRRHLSGSMKHFDMPLFKRQIGTVYEGKKQFEKAIECYKEALELAKELKIPGMVDIALYKQNIANAYCWLRNFEDAYQPAKNGYEIRKVILGRHPQTARSAFQMAQICRSLNGFNEAEEFYEEAWEIEKSLGQGNHSEVMVRIVESYEAILLKGKRKNQFRQEALDFYLHYWDEEKAFEGFEFSLANKRVIDSINERFSEFGDRQTQERCQKEALWFYEGAWNSPDTRKLPDTAREEILQTLCSLCAQLREKSKAEKYSNEAFSFHEKKWKRNKEGMSKHDRIAILTTLVHMATSQMKEKKKQKYESLLKEAKQTQTLMGRMKEFLFSGAKVEQLSSEDDDDDNEVDIPSDDDDDLDSSSGSEEIPEASGQVQQPTIPEEDGEELESEQEQDPDRIKIRESKIAHESETWNLAEAGASITFNLGAITKSLTITCSLWSPAALSPPIGSNELLVSNVIELSHDGPPDLEFVENASGSINVALFHSASNFKGYEVVIKQLVDPQYNEWEDLETKNVWHSSVNPTVPIWTCPFAEAACSKTWFSTFAAVWRLKSFVFPKLTSETSEFICPLPDYPNVSGAIPWSSLPTDRDFFLTLKVQEAPTIDHDADGMFVGPILHISCSHDVKLSVPAKISLPLALIDGEIEPAELHSGQVKILYFNSREESQEWTDITDHLDMPVVLRNGIVTFQVKTFGRFWPWLVKTSASIPRKYASLLYERIMKRHVGFFACLCKYTVPSTYLLELFCFPQHLRSGVDNYISSRYFVTLRREETSQKPLSSGDETYVSLSNGFEVHGAGNAKDIVLKFLGDRRHQRSLPVSIKDPSDLGIHFLQGRERENSPMICQEPIIPRSPVQACLPSGFVLPSSEIQRAQEMPRSNRNIQSSVDADSLHVHKKKLHVTLLATEWCSAKGGLSTINRVLAKQLSSSPNVKVTLFVPPFECECKEKDKAEAFKCDVNIEEADGKMSNSTDPLNWLAFPPEKLHIDVVVGHGWKLGWQAEKIRRSHSCKWVQMVHTCPEELAMHKICDTPLSRGEEKYASEVSLCEKADLVVTIGPKLKEAFAKSLRHCEEEKSVLSITPGVFSEFECVKTSAADLEKFYILVFGRCDPKDLSIKGYDTAAKAVAILPSRSYHLTIMGATANNQRELVDILVSCGLPHCQFAVRKFCTDRKLLVKLFSHFDLVLMPSRTEGFGLTGLEALSAGIPILVSGNSGFAEALRKVKFGELYIVEDFEDANEWAKKIKSIRQKERRLRFEEIRQLRTFYKEKYNWESQCQDLVATMSNMVYA